MKKTFLILFILVLLTFSSVLAEEETNETEDGSDQDEEIEEESDDDENETEDDTERLEVIQAHIAYQAEKITIAMETAIDYIQELGGDTTELEVLHVAFIDLAEDIESFTSLEDLRENNKNMKDIVKEFREKSNDLIIENGGDIETLRTRIQEALGDNTELEEQRKAFSENAQGFLLERFDRHYERLDNIYNRVLVVYGESSPDEVASLKTTLDSLAALRDSLESAAASGDKDTLHESYASFHELNQAFIQAVQDFADTNRGEGRNPMSFGTESLDDDEEENETEDDSDEDTDDDEENETEEEDIEEEDDEENETEEDDDENSGRGRGGY